MCYTPKISLSTAAIEFAVAAFIYIRYQKSTFARFLALFIFTLGFYQFSEFMFCTTGDYQTWGKIGFITYTFLPALGLDFVLVYTKKKFNRFLVYLPVFIFVVIALANNNFVANAECGHLFIISQNFFTTPEISGWPAIVYWLYYFSFIVAMLFYLLFQIKNESNKRKIISHLVIMITVLITIAPPLLLIMIFPALEAQFPSIYCQFALLFTIMALVAAYIDDKLNFSIGKEIKKLSKKLKR